MSEKLNLGQTQENSYKKPEALSNVRTIGKRVLDATYYKQPYVQYMVEGKALSALSKMNPSSIELAVANNALNMLGIVSFAEEIMGSRGYFRVGNHMSVHHSGFHAFKEKELSDGTSVHPGQKIVVIDLVRNIPTLGPDAKLLTTTRHLYNSVSRDLYELAILCQNNDPRLDGVEVFYGISHLAGPLAERLGFDTFKVLNPLKRIYPKIIEKRMVNEHAGENKDWKKISQKNKDIFEAFILRQKLIDKYCTQPNLDLHSHTS